MSQIEAVQRHMTQQFPQWWTFEQLRAALYADGIGISEAGLSARIRDLRKPQYGGYTVDRMPTGRKGVYAYRCRK